MTTKRTPTKDPEFAAYMRAVKRLNLWDPLHSRDLWNFAYGKVFRAGVAHGMRKRSKGK